MNDRTGVMTSIIINSEAQLASSIGLIIIIDQPVVKKSVQKR